MTNITISIIRLILDCYRMTVSRCHTLKANLPPEAEKKSNEL